MAGEQVVYCKFHASNVCYSKTVKTKTTASYPLISLRDRQAIANKVMDLANISSGILIFTNFNLDNYQSFLLLLVGTILLIGFYSFAIIYMRKKV